jgi:hypothetical protein
MNGLLVLISLLGGMTAFGLIGIVRLNEKGRTARSSAPGANPHPDLEHIKTFFRVKVHQANLMKPAHQEKLSSGMEGFCRHLHAPDQPRRFRQASAVGIQAAVFQSLSAWPSRPRIRMGRRSPSSAGKPRPMPCFWQTIRAS